MPTETFTDLPAGIAGALQSRGFTALTPVQRAVLDPALQGRDLRISSQTGSGKTVAIGLVLAADLERVAATDAAAAVAAADAEPESAKRPATTTRPACGGSATPPARGRARPAALIVAPTRELAAQVARELAWLLAPVGARICTVVGGTSVAGERRALAQGPSVVVGTPGRLVDHLERGAIDASAVATVVLDEADQMLDLGFREELEAILGAAPAERRTHLVSATFPREVLALANRYQRDAARVEGTAHGQANADIEHVVHLVRPDERVAALVNLLLLAPAERALVFVRTRADASEIAEALSASGFSARPLHGELEQWERTKTLGAFRAGAVTVLVATDVAARGLDVPDVARVIHADPPGDAEAFTHRSGRTGRAGKKGTSVVLVPPVAREYMVRVLHRARVEAVWRPAPSADDVRRAADERLRAEIAASVGEASSDASLEALATELLTTTDPTQLVAALLERARRAGPCEAQAVTPLLPPEPRREAPRAPAARPQAHARRPAGGAPPPRGRTARAPDARGDVASAFVPFRVNWGARNGADPRRLLALVCRRGGVASGQIGAIRIGDLASTVEVASPAASGFARSVQRPDARDPRIRIDPVRHEAGPARFRRANG